MSGLAQLREQLAAATPGEWEFSKHPRRTTGQVLIGDDLTGYGISFPRPADAALIVSLRNCAEELLAVAEAAEVMREHIALNKGCYEGCHVHDELTDALSALEVRIGAAA